VHPGRTAEAGRAGQGLDTEGIAWIRQFRKALVADGRTVAATLLAAAVLITRRDA
jgi:hypothetical protein